MQNKTYLHEPNIGEIHCGRVVAGTWRGAGAGVSV